MSIELHRFLGYGMNLSCIKFTIRDTVLTDIPKALLLQKLFAWIRILIIYHFINDFCDFFLYNSQHLDYTMYIIDLINKDICRYGASLEVSTSLPEYFPKKFCIPILE